MSFIARLGSVLALPFLLVSHAASMPVKSAHVEAELVSEVRSVRPGEAFWVALRLRMDEGWHTYYKDPGDAGMATSLEWELPEGFTAGPILWPAPQEIELDPLITVYGYEGEAFLLTRIEVAAHVPEGSREPMRARARWLACKEVCISGDVELVLELPVMNEEPLPDTRWSERIARARAGLPQDPLGIKGGL